MPFWALTTLVVGPSAAASRAAAGGSECAFSVTKTASHSRSAAQSSVHSGVTAYSPSASMTRRPSRRIASRCAPRAIRTTGSPARASRPPKKPPMAPAPRMPSFTRSGAKLLGDEAPLHLAGRRPRDLVHQVEFPRHLEIGELLPAKLGQLLLGHRRRHHHRRRHLLAPGRMGNAEGHRLLDGRMRLEHLIDLARRDLLPAAVDHLLDPSQQPDISAFVERALVAGSEPSLGEGRRVRLRVVLVAVDHVGPLDGHLTAGASRQLVPFLVEHGDLVAG